MAIGMARLVTLGTTTTRSVIFREGMYSHVHLQLSFLPEFAQLHAEQI